MRERTAQSFDASNPSQVLRKSFARRLLPGRRPLASFADEERGTEISGDGDEHQPRFLQYGLLPGPGDLSAALPTVPTDRLFSAQRRKLVFFLDSVPVQALLLLLIAFDLSLTIQQIVAEFVAPEEVDAPWIFYATLVIVSVLLLEVLLRMVGLGLAFFSRWWNSLDLAVSVLSFALELLVFLAYRDPAALGVDEGSGERVHGADAAAAGDMAGLSIISRVVRMMVVLARRSSHVKTAARLVVGGNKRRFIADGYNLDLCYVTDDLVGMSVPAVGGQSLYRNPIDEVARFFRERHQAQGYMIYNCTSECSYPSEPFAGRVRRIAIDDHNVPPLEVIVAFCRELEELRKKHPQMVFAIHCRGGKGRTGLMVCAWLLWTRRCETAQEALDLWARRRTDETIRGKMQGVQTTAQVRYVHYVEQLMATGRPLSSLRPRGLRCLRVRNLFAEGVEVEPGASQPADGALPWLVLTHVTPLGKVSLDTRPTPGSAHPSCVRQVGTDLVVQLPAGVDWLVKGDLKVEIFTDRVAGLAYLEAETRSAATLVAGTVRTVGAGNGTSSGRKGDGKGSMLLGESTLSSASKSIKAAKDAFAEGAPPSAGADCQLLLYTWMHTAMEPGSGSRLVLPASPPRSEPELSQPQP